jgi:hypothetical protein
MSFGLAGFLLVATACCAEARAIRRPPQADAGFCISLSESDLPPTEGVAGWFEDWRPDVAQFPKPLLGKGHSGWPGERWLDIRKTKMLAPILEARLDLAEFEALGKPIGGNDLWIAAHAMALKLALVTNNRREFDRIAGLHIEDWSQ